MAARNKAKKTHSFSGAIELADGTLITGKTTNFMGAVSNTLINALKYLAQLPDNENVIAPQAFGPIQDLKTKYLGSLNPRLHIQEVLIALSLSAVHNSDAKKALDVIPQLKGCQAHFTCLLKAEDLSILTQLGLEVTYEADKR